MPTSRWVTVALQAMSPEMSLSRCYTMRLKPDWHDIPTRGPAALQYVSLKRLPVYRRSTSHTPMTVRACTSLGSPATPGMGACIIRQTIIVSARAWASGISLCAPAHSYTFCGDGAKNGNTSEACHYNLPAAKKIGSIVEYGTGAQLNNPKRAESASEAYQTEVCFLFLPQSFAVTMCFKVPRACLHLWMVI